MTKQFNSLLEGMHYYTACPFCNQKLNINQKDLVADYDGASQRLSYSLYGDDLLWIDPKTEKVEVVNGPTSYTISSYYNSITYHRLGFECEYCFLFGYTIQIQVDLSKNKLIGVFLNSEKVSYEDSDNVLHEIKNIYTKNITEYTYYLESDTKQEKFPLVPLNVQNPEETINRIKNLMTFI